jgi:hypothetical protein
MITTQHNTTGECERCRRVKPYVLAVAFQGDGTGTFRMLCASCERSEKYRNAPHLFVDVKWIQIGEPEPEEEEPKIEEEPFFEPSPQLNLFA